MVPDVQLFQQLYHGNSGGTAWALMGECKHEWLPKVVMAPDFEQGWEEYMAAYNACKPEDFLAEMQAILDTFK